MPTRTPLTHEQARVASAAYVAHGRGKAIVPEDDEMRDVCEGLVQRGNLIAVPGGYTASPALRAALQASSEMN